MSEFGCLPDNVSYNTILDVFCKKGRLNEARDLLLDMKNRDEMEAFRLRDEMEI